VAIHRVDRLHNNIIMILGFLLKALNCCINIHALDLACLLKKEKRTTQLNFNTNKEEHQTQIHFLMHSTLKASVSHK
jgi:hypothetical protein